jgi:hypothetical protein
MTHIARPEASKLQSIADYQEDRVAVGAAARLAGVRDNGGPTSECLPRPIVTSRGITVTTSTYDS